jgi:DNA-binding CsgD family transcriptional regulator
MIDIGPLQHSSEEGSLSAERLKFATLTWLCSALKSPAGVFYLVDGDLRQSHFITYNADPSYHQRYVNGLYQLDPLHPRYFPGARQRVITLSDALPTSRRAGSEYFHTFLAPQGIRDIVEIFFRREDRIVAGISLLKFGSSAPVAGDDLKLVCTVHPLIEDYLGAVLSTIPHGGTEGHVQRYALTDRERVTLSLVQEGLSNKEIARRLGITVSTVKTHIRSILTKTGTTRRATLLSKLFWH